MCNSSFCWLQTGITWSNRAFMVIRFTHVRPHWSKIGYIAKYHEGKYYSSRVLLDWHHSYILGESTKTTVLACTFGYVVLCPPFSFIYKMVFNFYRIDLFSLRATAPSYQEGNSLESRCLLPDSYAHVQTILEYLSSTNLSIT